MKQEYGHTFRNKKFAYNVKKMASILAGVPMKDVLSREGKLRYLPEWDMTIGEMQQKIGTDAIRNNIHQNAWILSLFGNYKEDEDFWIITDVRFKNEAEIVKQKGGILIRLEGDPLNSKTNDGRNMTHQSEIDLDDYDGFDYVYENIAPLSNLKNFVKKIASQVMNETQSHRKIGLDIDGVLADFSLGWHKLYPEVSPRPNSWTCDPHMGNRFAEMKANNSLDDFYLGIEPYGTALDLPFIPSCYITSRPVSSEISAEWLNKHGFPTKKVYSVGINMSKVDAAIEAGIEIFVDDNYDNFVELNNSGITTYLYTAPWNIMFDVGDMRINSLKDLVSF